LYFSFFFLKISKSNFILIRTKLGVDNIQQIFKFMYNSKETLNHEELIGNLKPKYLTVNGLQLTMQ